jgi:hypothetical protein
MAAVTASVLGGHSGTLHATGWRQDGDGMRTPAKYSEAGAFKLQIIDPDFAAIDADDGTPYCQRTIGLSWTDRSCTKTNPVYAGPAAEVGRFVPDHFAVTLNKPSFATGCAAGEFTYVGQAFKFATQPVITVTAQNAGGGTTKNYTGDLFKLNNDSKSVTGPKYGNDGAPTDPRLQTGGLPTSGDPAIVDNGDGTATLSFSAGTGLDYEHGEPVAPFNSSIDLAITIKDTDGVTVTSIDGAPGTNPVTFSDIAFDNGSQMRYGRVFINDAIGSELMDLPMEMVAQYYTADDGFITNGKDTCTKNVDVTLGNFKAYPGPRNTFDPPDNNNPGVTTQTHYQLDDASRPPSLASGDFGLLLSAPGIHHQGTVDVTADVPAWLQFDWNDNGDENPTARAAFGIYRGNHHRIYQQEVIGPD